MGIVAESKDGKKDGREWNGMGLAGTRGASERLENGERAGMEGKQREAGGYSTRMRKKRE